MTLDKIKPFFLVSKKNIHSLSLRQRSTNKIDFVTNVIHQIKAVSHYFSIYL